mmetsp:Transcript_15507/g.40063  ORF Transcript_15507/g.40063 Transcript_15507/m.40063 type:complete len:269 (+) Transcript_15507:365-1171(+)
MGCKSLPPPRLAHGPHCTSQNVRRLLLGHLGRGRVGVLRCPLGGKLIGVLLDEHLHCRLHRVAQACLGLPVKLGLDEPHARDAQVRVLIALAIVLDAGDIARGAACLARELLVEVNHQLRKLLDLNVILRVAHVERLADRLVRVVDHAHHRLDGVLDEAEGAVHLAAVDKDEWVALHQRRHERRKHARLPVVLAVDARDVVHPRPDPVVRPHNRELEVVLGAVSVDEALDELLGARVAPALRGDGAHDHRRCLLVQDVILWVVRGQAI